MVDLTHFDTKTIVDSLGDGLYVCDLDRKITFWSKSAERLTGWSAEEVVGRGCFDNLLCHIDKDGHRLCGQEYCPLHRAMITDSRSTNSILVYAKTKQGHRIPVLVGVAPIQDKKGQVIGGVETFRDASEVSQDLERAKAIQELALVHSIPEDSRIRFTSHYVPCEIVGGDYYAYTRLDEKQYGLILADVMGHGIAAALYTMHLSSLWDRFHHLLVHPAEFAKEINNHLSKLIRSDTSFATAVCGVVDLEQREFRFASAGGPPVLIVHPDGTPETIDQQGIPLGIMEEASYEEVRRKITEGDRLMLFSDGAFEITNAAGKMLEMEGFLAILKKQGYPQKDLRMGALDKALLQYSDAIHLEDDLTLLEVLFNHA